MRPVPCSARSDGECHRVDHFQPGILAWVLGDHSAETFNPLWKIVEDWKCYFYVTRTHARSVPRGARSGALAPRWKVYPQFIPDGDQIICKTYMTRVEGENTRLRHYLGGAYAPDQAELGTGRYCVRITP